MIRKAIKSSAAALSIGAITFVTSASEQAVESFINDDPMTATSTLRLIIMVSAAIVMVVQSGVVLIDKTLDAWIKWRKEKREHADWESERNRK